MKNIMVVILWLIGVSAATPVFADKASPEQLARLYLDFMAQTSRQSETLWPGFRLDDKVHLFSYAGSVWLRQPGGEIIKDNSVLESVNLHSGLSVNFGFPQYQGLAGVLIQLESPTIQFDSTTKTADLPFVIWAGNSVHEAFHFYAQSEWRVLEDARRYEGEVYPLNFDARYYRLQLFNSLMSALKQPEQQALYLGHAAYWLQAWRQTAPNEDKVSYVSDLVEGSAKYVELIAGARFLSQNQTYLGYQQILLQYVQDYYQQQQMLGGWTAEAENIGALAGILLDSTQDGYVWKESVMSGMLPVDLLLGRIKPITPPVGQNSAQKKRLQDMLAYYPSTDQKLAQLLRDVQDPKVPLLVMPSVSDSSSFMDVGEVRSGFYVVPYQEEMTQAYLGMSVQFSNLNVSGSPLLDVPLQNYCEGIEAATLLPLGFTFQREGQYLVFNEPEIHGTIRVSASVVEGRTLYCAMN
ncbi:hypothetical protein N5C36_05400 [Shewanella xiamenensis]|jgi:hypothetical protein|uniref:Uncharacterized protein n=1 Tax=Shewanella xiamenensis TaxID=332186 RepID=A0AAE4TMR9_9GAMM|nr:MULTISPECIES: hypothetical protein [Shewanella]ASF16068.1 hypothetical protein CEQ32_14425 [Shewanella sp. FDAARGOS_354]MBW0295833.1 hypothetical protein [Shewanella xiamenensis]MDH1313521.1 hypothetical protein [Shewanella xiamenensis]MDV5392632.1 hypothetical protein [Shewanella xiamenensis]QQK61811.1 hypothetical protein FJD32_021360 [Shewanella sp. LC6]